jgi:glutaredoxin
MTDYTIYSKEDCVFCESAKHLFKHKEIEYKEVLIGKDITVQQLKEIFPLAKTLPIILQGDDHIGGYNELKNHLLMKEVSL